MSYISSNVPSSPTKFCRVNGSAATLARNKADARAELRTMAHRKAYVSNIDAFFDNFFPPNTSTSKKAVPNIFQGAPTTFSSEKAMYKWLCERLNSSGQFKGKVFVNTGYKADPSDETKQAIDCGMYLSENAPAKGFTALGEESRRNIWSALELGLECKLHDTPDPLDEQQEEGTDPTTDGGKNIWAQLLSYAALVFKFQKRLFHYIVLFFGRYARIFRFDHSGIVATEKIDYTTDEGGKRLTEFFVRYGRLQAKNRGHDPTTTRINGKAIKPKNKEGDEGLAELAEEMRKYGQKIAEMRPQDHVPPLFNKTLDEQWPWWRLKVYDEVTESCHYFAVGKPHFYSGGVVGRGTCGYIAVPLDAKNKPRPLRINKDGKPVAVDRAVDKDDETSADNAQSKDVYFVYLKDAWRVDHPGIEKEGAVLQVLNQHKVQYVPTVLYHGDLGDDTLSYAHWPEYHADEDVRDCPLKSHQHYRLVVAEVGKPLSEFANGLELVIAILCCVIAHKEACRAGYIHRDISAGNILLYPNAAGAWCGLLNDWELSKAFEDGKTKEGSRQLYRTGTWQFTSVHALTNFSRIMTVSDDLESFFHVLLYFAIRFLPHNATAVVRELLYHYFDEYTNGRPGQTSGSTKFMAMHHGVIDITRYTGTNIDEDQKVIDPYLKFLWPGRQSTNESAPVKSHPIDRLINELLQWFKALYARDIKDAPEDAEPTDQADAVSGAASLALLGMKGVEMTNRTPISSNVQETSEADKQKQLELAQKLETHDAMVELLLRYIQQMKWPAKDKGHDKKPKNGYTPPKDNIPATSTQIGSKRIVENGAEPSSKRVRSKARA
ncbi:hypothetical protein GSI_04018 [Ganoderma sinense ZZ0214-1]|uniref:Protein kinase domain-containing protein n=1 Tax=Ganoderma sinense ZZ0214-1 TaxID=1077348 RepID=A0A2G8SI50_9APHY|nr:hypothetical protein GSI_04018 [Ganoderma sinense ZZ0214-1]